MCGVSFASPLSIQNDLVSSNQRFFAVAVSRAHLSGSTRTRVARLGNRGLSQFDTSRFPSRS
jgi:hypothetical protein